MFFECSLVSFQLRDLNYPFLADCTKSCFIQFPLRYRSILGLFYANVSVLRSCHGRKGEFNFSEFFVYKLKSFLIPESRSDLSQDHLVSISFSFSFPSSNLQFCSFLWLRQFF